jgi:hypothetical protein
MVTELLAQPIIITNIPVNYIAAYALVSSLIVAVLLVTLYFIRRDMAREMKKIDILVEKAISLKYR